MPENSPKYLWTTLVDSVRPILSDDDIHILNACILNEEAGKWQLYVPNAFALKTVNEKLLPIIQLALEKKGIQKITTIQGEPKTADLFNYKERKKEKATRKFKSNLNTDYQFENFVVGSSNDKAYHAAYRIGSGIFSIEFNPLVIYGGTGLGKSHLMHAIGNALRNHGRDRVLYLTAEEFTNDFIETLGNPKASMDDFRQYYRGVDALLIDDVQFLGGKDQSQAEFFNTYNSLIDKKCPIILTSDCLPREIPDLEPRLKSRFGQGLSVSVMPPNYETRVAILMRKAQSLNFYLSNEVAQFIAHHVVSNVRELEGALRKIYAQCDFLKQEATIPVAREALQDLINAQNKQISLPNIRKIVANHYHVNEADLDSKSRKSTILLPRQVAMHLTRQLTQHSTTEIGKHFGNRDHSTVINACKRIDDLLANDHIFAETYQQLKMTIQG